MIKNVVKKIMPKHIWDNLREKYYSSIRKCSSPIYIWGYKDSTGSWRPRTRMSNTVFMNHPERIIIKDNVFVGHYTILDGIGGIKIGEGSQISAGVYIFTHSSHSAIRLYGKHYQEIPEGEKKTYHVKPVVIGKYVFIGAHTIIIPGVIIGDGSVISAGSIVKINVDNFSMVSGNPASVIGSTKVIDNKYLDGPQLMEWYKEWQEV